MTTHRASGFTSILDDVSKRLIALGVVRMPLDRHTTARIRSTAALQTTNVLLSLTILVGVLHVAVDLGIRIRDRFGLATRLALLAIRAHRPAGTVNLAAALVGSARDGTKPGLHIGLQHLRRGEGRGINLLERTVRGKALGLALHGFASLLRSLVHLVSLRASPCGLVVL